MDNGFLANEYDLYFYDESAHYWRNYKPNGQYAGFYIAPLKGYLYANSANDTLGLTGTLRAATETVDIPLSYTDGIELAGFNLVGNPFAHNVTTFTGSNIATEIYRMNGTKDNLMVSVIDGDNPLKPGEGFFVKATGEDATITFTAKTSDYVSRFRLVFSAQDNTEGDDAPFAYVSNGNIVITADAGDATLQIVDVMGRVVRTVGLSQCGSRTTVAAIV